MADNRILRQQIQGCVRFSDGERRAFGYHKVEKEVEALVRRMAQERRS